VLANPRAAPAGADLAGEAEGSEEMTTGRAKMAA
jgi:hypothetical protein